MIKRVTRPNRSGLGMIVPSSHFTRALRKPQKHCQDCRLPSWNARSWVWAPLPTKFFTIALFLAVTVPNLNRLWPLCKHNCMDFSLQKCRPRTKKDSNKRFNALFMCNSIKKSMIVRNQRDCGGPMKKPFSRLSKTLNRLNVSQQDGVLRHLRVRDAAGVHPPHLPAEASLRAKVRSAGRRRICQPGRDKSLEEIHHQTVHKVSFIETFTNFGGHYS